SDRSARGASGERIAAGSPGDLVRIDIAVVGGARRPAGTGAGRGRVDFDAVEQVVGRRRRRVVAGERTARTDADGEAVQRAGGIDSRVLVDIQLMEGWGAR